MPPRPSHRRGYTLQLTSLIHLDILTDSNKISNQLHDCKYIRSGGLVMKETAGSLAGHSVRLFTPTFGSL